MSTSSLVFLISAFGVAWTFAWYAFGHKAGKAREHKRRAVYLAEVREEYQRNVYRGDFSFATKQLEVLIPEDDFDYLWRRRHSKNYALRLNRADRITIKVEDCKHDEIAVTSLLAGQVASKNGTGAPA